MRQQESGGELGRAASGGGGLPQRDGLRQRRVDEHAVPADVTVTFAYAKQGHFLFPAAHAWVNRWWHSRISPALADDIYTFALAPDYVAPPPNRGRVSHKGSFGKAMACGGQRQLPRRGRPS